MTNLNSPNDDKVEMNKNKESDCRYDKHVGMSYSNDFNYSNLNYSNMNYSKDLKNENNQKNKSEEIGTGNKSQQYKGLNNQEIYNSGNKFYENKDFSNKDYYSYMYANPNLYKDTYSNEMYSTFNKDNQDYYYRNQPYNYSSVKPYTDEPYRLYKTDPNNFQDMNEYYNNQRYYDDQYYESNANSYGNFTPYNPYPKLGREMKRKAKQRICSNCNTTSTPSWRRGENGKSLLCNACGLYQKLHGRARPYTVTPNGRTKALKGGYEKTLCVSCNNLYPISEIRGSNNAHVCDNCMVNIKNAQENGYNYNDYQYYKYGNYHNYYNGQVDYPTETDPDNVNVNNNVYENLQSEVLPRNDFKKDF